MLLSDIYNADGVDGIENKKAFDKLPAQLRYFINSSQLDIVNRVLNLVIKKYGKQATKDIIKTSGFRAISTNARNNGVTDSLHLFGCAADFRKVGIFEKEPLPVCDELQIIDSGKCWHVQYRRPKING